MADKKAKPAIETLTKPHPYDLLRMELAEHKHPHEHPEYAAIGDNLESLARALVNIADKELAFSDAIGKELDGMHNHGHPLLEHDHKHDHRDLRGHFRGVVRALLEVIEVGSKNSEQVKAIHAVRVIIGDAHGSDCTHENVAYEAGDILVCQDCRTKVETHADR